MASSAKSAILVCQRCEGGVNEREEHAKLTVEGSFQYEIDSSVCV